MYSFGRGEILTSETRVEQERNFRERVGESVVVLCELN